MRYMQQNISRMISAEKGHELGLPALHFHHYTIYSTYSTFVFHCLYTDGAFYAGTIAWYP